MRKFHSAIVGAALLALSACGGAGDDAAGDNAADNAEMAADNLEAAADNTTNDAAAAALENQADAIEEAGENKEAAIDAADTTNAQ